MKRFYLLAAVLGGIIPWLSLARFFLEEGLNLGAFFGGLFANHVASAASLDLLLSALIFLVWAYVDARQRGIARWWVLLPSTFLIGLSCALPLYLYMREGRQAA